MTALTVELAPEDFACLEREAQRRGTTATALAQELITGQLSSAPPGADETKSDILAALDKLDELRADLRRRGVPSIDAVELVKQGRDELDRRADVPNKDVARGSV
ncbi:MAG: hypothetical protein GEU73_11165 [Chloroflexi bacterium]|nr:hypothetical protein [Chloroflexota bacterium]